MDSFIRAVTFLSRVAGVIAALLIGLAVLVICDMVIERYMLNLTTIWQIDVVTYSIVGATFIGSPYVLMTRGHVNVDILPLHLGPRARYWLALFTSAAGARRSASCCSSSARPTGTRPIPSAGAPTRCGARGSGFPISSMPVGLGLLVLQYVADMSALVTGRAPPFGIKDRSRAPRISPARRPKKHWEARHESGHRRARSFSSSRC